MSLALQNRDTEPARLTIRFDDFEFKTMPLGLKRARSPIEVRPQSLRLLELLVCNAGRIMSTEEIQKWLWPSARHGDHARIIRVSMTHLRRALGDRQKPPKYIETIRGVGYRFVAPLEYSESQLVRRAASAGWAG